MRTTLLHRMLLAVVVVMGGLAVLADRVQHTAQQQPLQCTRTDTWQTRHVSWLPCAAALLLRHVLMCVT
jgi:hypothetical protein